LEVRQRTGRAPMVRSDKGYITERQHRKLRVVVTELERGM
jgi:hypothetical protein